MLSSKKILRSIYEIKLFLNALTSKCNINLLTRYIKPLCANICYDLCSRLQIYMTDFTISLIWNCEKTFIYKDNYTNLTLWSITCSRYNDFIVIIYYVKHKTNIIIVQRTCSWYYIYVHYCCSILQTLITICTITTVSATSKCEGGGIGLKYLWGDAMTDSPDCLGPNNMPYPA